MQELERINMGEDVLDVAWFPNVGPTCSWILTMGPESYVYSHGP